MVLLGLGARFDIGIQYFILFKWCGFRLSEPGLLVILKMAVYEKYEKETLNLV